MSSSRPPARIALEPHLALSAFRPAPPTPPFDFRWGPNLQLTYSGTSALYQAIHALRSARATQVLIPAYNCGHELEAALRAGAQVAFYRLSRDLQPDVEQLGELLAQRRPANTLLLLTHYFGFAPRAPDIVELCRQYDVHLVEDCAHRLLEPGNPSGIGRDAAAVVFSLRKTLPIATGGALWLRQDKARSHGTASPPAQSLLRRRLFLALKSFRASQGPVPAALAVPTRGALELSHAACMLLHRLGRVQHDPDDEAYDFPGASLSWDMDTWSKGLLHRFDYTAIAARRRRNYSLLHAEFSKRWPERLLLPAATTNDCPLNFPFLTRNREALLARLDARGVPTLDWWSQAHAAVPWHAFPWERELKACVTTLPVHQDLDGATMAAILAAISKESDYF